jgi:hypothetical protein
VLRFSADTRTRWAVGCASSSTSVMSSSLSELLSHFEPLSHCNVLSSAGGVALCGWWCECPGKEQRGPPALSCGNSVAAGEGGAKGIEPSLPPWKIGDGPSLLPRSAS